jgi:hypothetical protein
MFVPAAIAAGAMLGLCVCSDKIPWRPTLSLSVRNRKQHHHHYTQQQHQLLPIRLCTATTTCHCALQGFMLQQVGRLQHNPINSAPAAQTARPQVADVSFRPSRLEWAAAQCAGKST